MLSFDYTKDLLNLQDVNVTKIEHFKTDTIICTQLPVKPHICPCCSHTTSYIHDYRVRKIKDIYIDAYSTANIFDNARQKDTIINTISHELTHQMEVYSPDTFKEVSDLILDALVKTAQLSDKSITRADLIANEIDRLDKAHPGEKHTDADAISEIVARACEDMLSESKAGRELFNSLSESEQKTLTDRIKDIIAKFKKWIDNLLKSYSSNSDEAKALRRMKDSFDEVLKKWDSMLLDIAETNKAIKEGKTDVANVANDGKVMFSEKEIIGVSGQSYGVGVYLDSNL